MTTHTQVHLEHVQTGARQTTWVPSTFAEIGRVLRLKDRGEWSNGWRVQAAFVEAPTLSAVIAERERDFRTHRRATDI